MKQALNYELLAEIWKIPEPELIISIHGSGLHPELISGHIVASRIKEETYKTAVSTRAWLTTRGLNNGLAALIGSARRELGRELGDKTPIIGFPLWNEIKNKESFVSQNDQPGRVTESSRSGVQYYTVDTDCDKLEINHTHHLMFNGHPASNFKFRFHLESFIRENCKKWGIPTVNFLISGGIADLMRVRLGLHERHQLVIFEGSGGAAEILALSLHLYRKCFI